MHDRQLEPSRQMDDESNPSLDLSSPSLDAIPSTSPDTLSISDATTSPQGAEDPIARRTNVQGNGNGQNEEGGINWWRVFRLAFIESVVDHLLLTLWRSFPAMDIHHAPLRNRRNTADTHGTAEEVGPSAGNANPSTRPTQQREDDHQHGNVVPVIIVGLQSLEQGTQCLIPLFSNIDVIGFRNQRISGIRAWSPPLRILRAIQPIRRTVRVKPLLHLGYTLVVGPI